MSATSEDHPRGPDPVDVTSAVLALGGEEVVVPEANTALAFVLAPGLSAVAGSAVYVLFSVQRPMVPVSQTFGDALVLLGPLASVGYLTALIVAVPVLLLLPERARSAFALVVPLAGAIAAAPWLALLPPWRSRPSDCAFLLIPFALGCVRGDRLPAHPASPRPDRPGRRGGKRFSGPRGPDRRAMARVKRHRPTRAPPRRCRRRTRRRARGERWPACPAASLRLRPPGMPISQAAVAPPDGRASEAARTTGG